MPRGFCPTFSVETTLSVAVSITEIVAEPSLETYAKGAASPAGAPHRVNAQPKTIAAVERSDIQVSVSSTGGRSRCAHHTSPSIIGFGLECGYLCEDSQQFPIHPSSSLLRDQTSFLAFVGNVALVDTLEEVTRDIAAGYSGAAKADRSFAKAIGGLRTYIAQVQQVLAAGHTRPETAQLLIDQANMLIQRIEAL